MPPNPSDLAELRRHLDEIDDKLHDLLIERAEIVSVVAASKKEGNLAAFQPGREAQIIRRLVDRHHGEFPIPTLVRMWREMLAATVRLQSPFAVAVYAPIESQGFWDLARDHYGSHTPMSAYRSIGQVIRAVTEGQASVGVEHQSGADHCFPPTGLAGYRMGIGNVLVPGQRVADQDRIRPIRVERAIGLIRDRERANIDPTVQPQGLAHKQTVPGPILVRTRAEVG